MRKTRGAIWINDLTALAIGLILLVVIITAYILIKNFGSGLIDLINRIGLG